jgi:lysophospholipase L1-like esterase
VTAAALLVVVSNGAAHAQSGLVAYGDSYIHPGSSGVRQGQATWITLLHGRALNLGHAGDGVSRTLAVVRRTSWQVHEDVVVEVGINDVRRSGTDPGKLAAFARRYGELLDDLDQAQRIVVVPPLPIRNWGSHGSELALEQHRDIVIRLVGEHRNARLADPLPAWRPDTMLLSDGIHPNRQGRALIAGLVGQALR